MAFGKRFPKTIEGSNYPIWEEINLTKDQETEVEENARKENIRLMKLCLDDAKKMMADKGLREYDNNQITIALALFEKLASHSVFWKEALCKDIFDSQKQPQKKAAQKR